MDEIAERFGEAVGDAVHASDWLEHGGLPVDLLFVELAGGHIGGEELGELEGLVDDELVWSGAGRDREAGTHAAGVTVVGAEIAEVLKELEEALGVLFGELVVEGVFVDGLGEEFGEVSAGVVDDLTLLDWLALVELGGLHEGGTGGVDFYFEGHAQIVAVVEEMHVNGRDTRGAGVEIVAVLPLADLSGAVGELDFGALADGPTAATGAIARFKDGAIEACFSQFVGRDHPGDTSAENDYLLALAEVGGELRERGLANGGHEAEGLHAGECGGISTELGHAVNKCTSGQAHGNGSDRFQVVGTIFSLR